MSWCIGLLTNTSLGHGSKHAHIGSSGVRNVQLSCVGNEKAGTEQADVLIQIVVGKIHVVVPSLSHIRKRWWSLYSAWEAAILRREWRLPHMAKLIQDIWHFGLICLVVHEDDHALSREDQLRESRPLILSHWHIWWCINIRAQSGVLYRSGVVSHSDVVTVDNQERHYVVWMRLDPLPNSLQLGLIGSSVQDIAVGMTVVDGVVHIVGFTLDCEEDDISFYVDDC